MVQNQKCIDESTLKGENTCSVIAVPTDSPHGKRLRHRLHQKDNNETDTEHPELKPRQETHNYMGDRLCHKK